jgi:creatinine amidohydrolase
MHTWIPAERQLAYLTWKQVEAINKDHALIVLPTAAIEQHGHHLPLATDTLINNLLLGQAFKHLPANAPVYTLPPVCYGKSNEHVGFPGTMSLSASTFMAVLRDLGSSLHASGFKKVVLYNTHGGNQALDDVMARDLRAEFGLRTFFLSGTAGAKFAEIKPQEAAYGFHANEFETAVLLAATPELVQTREYTVNYIADINTPSLLKPEFAPATFSWLTRDIAPSGVMGDPRPATAENGAKWVEAASFKIAEALIAMLNFREFVPQPAAQPKPETPKP